jgi:hypothetical protein
VNALFDYGEFLLCVAPIFIIIAAVGLLLLANSLPKRQPLKKNIKEKDDE